MKTELNLTGSNDIIFKAIMFQHPNCLKAIIEILMNKKIETIKILNAELSKQQFIEKGKRLDAYLESSQEYIDIEVSTSYNETIKNRNLSYVCHIYCNSVKKGEDYLSYKKASMFNLVWGEKGGNLHTTGRLTDEYGNIISDMLSYHTYHMDNYMERYYNNDIKFILEYKHLIMLRLRLDEFNRLIELTGGDEIVKEYKEALEEVINDDEIAPFIEGKNNQMALKKAIQKAFYTAIQKAENEFMDKGIQKGIQIYQRKAIRVLFSNGMTVMEIADELNIPEDFVASILY